MQLIRFVLRWHAATEISLPISTGDVGSRS